MIHLNAPGLLQIKKQREGGGGGVGKRGLRNKQWVLVLRVDSLDRLVLLS